MRPRRPQCCSVNFSNNSRISLPIAHKRVPSLNQNTRLCVLAIQSLALSHKHRRYISISKGSTGCLREEEEGREAIGRACFSVWDNRRMGGRWDQLNLRDTESKHAVLTQLILCLVKLVTKTEGRVRMERVRVRSSPRSN